MTFWILLTLLSIAIILPVIWPLLRRSAPAGLDDAQSRLAVQRDRRQEIDSDEAAGRLTPDEARRARAELIDHVAAELATQTVGDASAARTATPASPAPANGSAANSTPRRTITALAIGLLVPIAAIGVYRTVGAPQADALPAASAAITEDQVRGLLNDLIKRTEAEPDNGQAWLMLAQTHRALEQLEPAVQAYRRATELLAPNARLLADQAETIALMRGRDFGKEPRELLLKALALDANEPKANALMAAVELQAGNRTAALPYLRQVLASLEPGTQQAAQIDELIRNIGGESAVAGGRPAQAASPEASQPSAAPAPVLITGSVTLAGEPAPPGAVLFISARAADGPRMPYAALRLTDIQWPVRFELSDANAMSPQRLLSGAATVVVDARLSLSGTAVRQPGDRFGASAPLAPGSNAGRDITIVIDQTVP